MNASGFWPWLQQNSSTLSDLVQMIAIAIAGGWTYQLFIRGRQSKQKADLSVAVEAVGLDEQSRYVRIGLQLKNVGNVRIVPSRAHCSIQQILPFDASVNGAVEVWSAQFEPANSDDNDSPSQDSDGENNERLWRLAQVEIPWPVIDTWYINLEDPDELVTLEPGESEAWQADFVLERALRQAQVHVVVWTRGKGFLWTRGKGFLWTRGKDFLWDSTLLVDLDRLDASARSA